MTIKLIYIAIILTLLISCIGMINAGPNPEELIQGEWKEIAWEYELADIAKSDLPAINSIGQNMVIHKAEAWNFLNDGILKLAGNNNDKNVTWRLKGRGNILQLKYTDNSSENYIVTELTKTKMVLNFETDIQAKGIAKLSFEKVTN